MCTNVCYVLLSIWILMGCALVVMGTVCPSSFKRPDGTCCKPTICQKDERVKYCNETQSIGKDYCEQCPPDKGNPQVVNTGEVYDKLEGEQYDRCLPLKCDCPIDTRIVKCAYNIRDVVCECKTPWYYGTDPHTCNRSSQEQLKQQRRAGYELTQTGKVVPCGVGRYKPDNDDSLCIPYSSCKDGEVILKNGSSTNNVVCGRKDVEPSITESTPDSSDTDKEKSGTDILYIIIGVAAVIVVLVVAVICNKCIRKKPCRNVLRYGIGACGKFGCYHGSADCTENTELKSVSSGSMEVSGLCDSARASYTQVSKRLPDSLYTGNTGTGTSLQGDSVRTSDTQNSTRHADSLYTGNTGTGTSLQGDSVRTSDTQNSTGHADSLYTGNTGTGTSSQGDSVRTSDTQNSTGHADSLYTGNIGTGTPSQGDSVRTSDTQNSGGTVSSGKVCTMKGKVSEQRPIQRVSPMKREQYDECNRDHLTQPVDLTTRGVMYNSGRFPEPVQDMNQSVREDPGEDSTLLSSENQEEGRSDTSQLLSDMLNGDVLDSIHIGDVGGEETELKC